MPVRSAFVSRRVLLLAVASLIPAAASAADDASTRPDVVRVMTFNLWHGGDAGGQPLAQTVAAIRAARADVVGMQETGGYAPQGEERPDRSAEIARELGWHHFDQGARTAVISRYPIVSNTPSKWGVEVTLPSGRSLWVFNAHLKYTPYQPYQLVGIPYGDAPFLKTEADAIAAANQTRGAQVGRMLKEVAAVKGRGAAVVTGDFNEPSHLDWTKAAARAKRCPLPVRWPSTAAIVEAGFVDAYRTVHPNPVRRPGLTWTPTKPVGAPGERHDRIDFILARGLAGDEPADEGSDVEVQSAEVVGESPTMADVVVAPYPSDHRAVVAELKISGDAASR